MMRASGQGVVRAVAFVMVGLVCAAMVAASGRTAPAAPGQLTRLTIFVGPTPIWDSVWMADRQGYFRDEGIDASLKTFPAGTIALQSFKAGLGDIVLNGDLPAIEYWANTHHPEFPF